MSGLSAIWSALEALDQFNAQRAQLVAHGGVDAGVAAGNAVAGFTGQGGQPAHEGAANTKNVEVHGSILGSFQAFLA
jgi:hypothetical protein